MDFSAHTYVQKFEKLKIKKTNFLDVSGLQAEVFHRFCIPTTEVTIFEMKYNILTQSSSVTGRYITKKIKVIEYLDFRKVRLVFE